VSQIPPFELVKQYSSIQDELSQTVLDVLASGRYINGPIVEQFEQELASYIGTSTCVACNSGTDALYLALRAFQIGPGDEVITTPFTFISTAQEITAVGATPVFIDIDPQTYNLDIHQVEAAITARTKAIIPVHLFGQPVDMTRLMAIAQAHHLVVIEDCAQATGSAWNGQKVGSFGHVGCFSFYPTKNLGACGDGGAITTNDETIAAHLRMLREHGSKNRYLHEMTGINSRLDVIQAAILKVKLRYLDHWNAQRQAIAERYHQFLQSLPGVVLPQTLAAGQSVWNQYTLRLLQPHQGDAPLSDSLYRDRVRAHLQNQGVGSMVYYPLPLHLQPVYIPLGYKSGDFLQAEQLSREVLSLPMFPELSVEQQEQVVYALKDSLIQAIAR
jgi:dTDP-4-amino-4,6-dideoxygalactose transaminase